MSKGNKKRNNGGGFPRQRLRQSNPKLDIWKMRLAESDAAYGSEVERMNERERIYNGTNAIRPVISGDTVATNTKPAHRRNIVFENIESQISSAIPQPKVTAIRREDEPLAEIIERFLRNELDRLPFEQLNDMAERTVPIQGGVGFLVEWDNSRRTHTTIGEVSVSVIHPKQFAPQPGVYTGIADMDWFIIKMPTTKETIRRKYGIDVRDEGESEPELRSVDGTGQTDEALTQYVGFEVNELGQINKFTWVNDVVLEDLQNYQSRRQPVCAGCGRVRPLHGQIISNGVVGDPLSQEDTGTSAQQKVAAHAMASQIADEFMQGITGDGAAMLPFESIPVEPGTPQQPEKYDGGPCPWCGCDKFTDREQAYEEVILPIHTQQGMEIPGMTEGLNAQGLPVMKPTIIPFYMPGMYPIVLQRSVSVFGQLLGNSDVDVIEDQQNTTNRLEQKIIERLLKAGCRVTLPDNAKFRIDSKDYEKWYVKDAADKNLIGLYEFKGNLEYELHYLSQVYEESRQILGITDSFQGRADSTATSGKAKEFAAAQSAGRLESKRVMKNAAYAAIFELMFKNWLAYSDEPRPIVYRNFEGKTEYQEFNRYDFLKQDSDGQYYWNDQFLFSTDTSATLASNREAMWQETRQNLQSGAFGDPKSTSTLILFWGKMEQLHYPGAGETKQFLEARLEQEQQAMQEQMQAQLQAQSAGPGAAGAMGGGPVGTAVMK